MSTVSDFNLQDFVATRCAIADISLADFGRKEIAIAETEMPGLSLFVMSLLQVSHYVAHALLVHCT